MFDPVGGGSSLIAALLTAISLAGVGQGPAPGDLDQTRASQRVAVVVGLDSYGADENLQNLRFASADARAMAEVLGEDGYQVHLVADQASEAEFLDTLSDATRTLQREDVFVLYFAGHAQLVPGAGPHGLELLFSDHEGVGDGLGLQELEERLSGLASRQRVVVLDTCYSERSQQLLASLRGAEPSWTPPDVGELDVWIYSAAPQQSAQEDADLGHGVFTHYLLEALKGEADVDGDGSVGVLEAYNWVGFRTAEHTGRAQVPRIEEARTGWSDLALTRPGAASSATDAIIPWYERVLPGSSVWIDGQARGPGALTPGEHSVEVRDGQDRVVLNRTLQAQQGHVLAVEPWLRAAKPQVLVGLTGAYLAPRDRIPALQGGVVGWWYPRSARSWRPVLGTQLQVGQLDGGSSGAGLVRGGVLTAVRPWLWTGPTMGAGLTWREVPVGVQGAPTGQLAWRASVTPGAAWLALDGGARAWPVDGQWVAHPSLALSAGVRW